MIPAMALPFSVVGTFSVMYLLNFSMNNISMMALILSIGFVVDDAIVMLENIVRHIEKGEALRGGSQGVEGNRITICLHDAVPGIARLHTHSVHGRHSGAALPRVRDHYLHRHPDLRDVSSAHGPMLCTPFPARYLQQRHDICTASWKGVRQICTFTALAWGGCAAPSGDAGYVLIVLGTTGLSVCGGTQGFIRIRTTTISMPRWRPRRHLVLPDGEVPATGLIHHWCRIRTSRPSIASTGGRREVVAALAGRRIPATLWST